MIEGLFQKNFQIGSSVLTIKHNIFSGIKYFYFDNNLVMQSKPKWFEASDSHVLYINGLKVTIHTKVAWHGGTSYSMTMEQMGISDPLLGNI